MAPRAAAVAAAVGVLGAAAGAAAQNPWQLSWGAGGNFTVSAAGWPGFALTSNDVGVAVNGSWLSASNGGLQLAGPVESFTGQDGLGPYTGYAGSWMTAGAAAPTIITLWRVYATVPAVAFEQYIPTGWATGGSYADRDGVATSFPTFAPPANATNVGVMHYEGPFINNGIFGPTFVRWAPGVTWQNGLTGGPLVFFDAASPNAAVFSSMSNFMSGNTAQDATGAVRVGLLGSFTELPAEASYATVLWWGTGVNAVVSDFGGGMLRLYGKATDGWRFDPTVSGLVYNTDHGAYYYYTTGTYPDYLTALTAVFNYSQAVGIPYRGVLLDSWWYYKGIGDGVYNWTAMPSIFPGGNAGIAALTAATGWKVIAHNRYWAADTNYAAANGGAWSFDVDAAGSPAGGQMAVPLQQAFWETLLKDSVREWGLTTYEQDWLYNELEGVDALTSTYGLARQWMLQMNAGADAAGVTMQLCMPYPRHVLQSLEMPRVTQVRTSDDHVPGWAGGDISLQWRIGYSNMLAWAVALAPFKDNFFSINNEPGGSVGNYNETSPALQIVVSVLSAGPVTPGDGVGMSDPVAISRACTTGGRLLHPSRAATAVDAQAVARVFPGAGPAGEVWSTFSTVSGWLWDTVYGAVLTAPYNVTVADVASTRTGSTLPPVMPPVGVNATVAYSVNATTFAATSFVLQPFDAAHPIPLAACGEVDFQLWHTAPVFANGWAYLGELVKVVPVSPDRTVAVSVMGTDLAVEVTGEAGEPVPLAFYDATSGTVITVACMLDAAGRAVAIVPYATCA